MNVPRKKPAVRLFTGLAGRFTPEEKPSLEIVSPLTAGPAIPAMAPPSPESIAALEQEILSAKKKRGRPRLHINNAEKQRVHRKTKKERDDQAAAEKDFQEKINGILWENRDDAGRLHGEISGGDATFVTERVGTYAWVDIEGQRHENGGSRVRPTGCDGKAFERGVGPNRGQKDEKISTWMNRQNFFQAAYWDGKQKQEFIVWMAQLILGFEDLENGEDFVLRCQMCPYKRVIDKDYRETLNNSGFSYHDLPSHHLSTTHKKFVKDMIEQHEPHPPELRKKSKCSDADHRRYAEVFADRLPVRCRYCKKLVTGIS